MYEKDDIIIISGEGEIGTCEYAPGLSVCPEEISERLERERCDGDRWAQAVRYSHDTDGGPVGVDVETGAWVTLPDWDDLD